VPDPSHPFKPSLILHGGAWSSPDGPVEESRAGCLHALEAGWAVLSRGGAAIDALEAVIVAMENDPTFNAGTGANLNWDGYVELDAIVMDGRTLKAGAVAAVGRIRNPIRLARRVLESSPHMLLAAAGAEQFACEQGMELCDPAELVTERARVAWQRRLESAQTKQHLAQEKAGGTVGAVALDCDGNLVAGTSTGGTLGKHAGRIGDSPLIGCGCYADAEAGGVSCTGWGEAIMKIVMAKTAVELLRKTPTKTDAAPNPASSAAARECVRLLAERVQGYGGLILLDRFGYPGFAFNTPRMPRGYIAENGALVVEV
jgi:beta-aspartyl-peptidase (threonine type)